MNISTALRASATILLVLIAHAAQAQNGPDDLPRAEVALSNDTLQLRYRTSGEAVNIDRGLASAGFLLTEDRDIVFDGDVLFPIDLDLRAFSILVGPRAYAALLDEENSDVMSVSLGTEVRLELDRQRGLAIMAHAFYAPDILTFGSADNLTDLGARIEIGLAPRLTVFGGMRWFEFDLTEGQGERTLQEELFAGVAWRF